MEPRIHGDINQDGTFDFNDTDSFFILLTMIGEGFFGSLLPPGGSVVCLTNTGYEYSSLWVTLKNDSVYYQFNWGNILGEWVGPFEPYQPVRITHTWIANGYHSIQVRAKDMTGLESNWSIPLQVFVYTLGDLNFDGIVDFEDIDLFIAACWSQSSFYEQYPFGYYWAADCNLNGVVNFGDINPFVALLSGN
jgi:hypothetical protein